MSLFSSVSIHNLFILTHVFYSRMWICVWIVCNAFPKTEPWNVYANQLFQLKEVKMWRKQTSCFYSENVYCVKRVTALSAARLSKPSVWKKTRLPEETLAALAGGLPFKIYLERLDSHNNRALRAYEAVFLVLPLYSRFSLVLRSSVTLWARLSCVGIDLIAVVRHKLQTPNDKKAAALCTKWTWPSPRCIYW